MRDRLDILVCNCSTSTGLGLLLKADARAMWRPSFGHFFRFLIETLGAHAAVFIAGSIATNALEFLTRKGVLANQFVLRKSY